MRGVILAVCLAIGAPASADQTVVTDGPVTQSLVSALTGTLPDSILDPGSDPHHFSLRPSQVRALALADLIVWIGPELTPWLGESIQAVGPTVHQLQLDNGDPHGWLDPEIATEWQARIADALGVARPETPYRVLTAELQQSLKGLSGVPLLVGHDAYAALANRFGLTIAGAISDGHAAPPGAAHLADLRAMVANGQIACVVSDSPEIARFVDLVTDGSDVRVISLDLSGLGIPEGPDFYPTLMRRIASDLAACTE